MGNKNFADTMAINRPDKQDDGLDAMFGASTQERPRKYANQSTDTKDGRKQITFKLPVQTIEKLRAMAYWRRLEQWEIVDDALLDIVAAYEKKYGKLKPIPTRERNR